MMSRRAAFALMAFCLALTASAADSTIVSRWEVGVAPSFIIQNNRYLRGANPEGRKIDKLLTMGLKNAFANTDDSVHVSASQGIGAGLHLMDRQMGTPFDLYLMQTVPLLRLSRGVTLYGEWNLGASAGWKSYDEKTNPDNHVIGAPVNVYAGGLFYLAINLSQCLDLNVGYSYVHFSNANLAKPNEGFNAMGLWLSLAYYHRRKETSPERCFFDNLSWEKHQRCITDVTVYGGWKNRGVNSLSTYFSAGFSVNPMWKVWHSLALGPSLDGVYDHSINVKQVPAGDGTLEAQQPHWTRQLALGVSARAELLFPIFRANLGIGYLPVGFHGAYETLTLKADLCRYLFLSFGYCLYNYRYGNNLMLGIGCRI